MKGQFNFLIQIDKKKTTTKNQKFTDSQFSQCKRVYTFTHRYEMHDYESIFGYRFQIDLRLFIIERALYDGLILVFHHLNYAIRANRMLLTFWFPKFLISIMKFIK